MTTSKYPPNNANHVSLSIYIFLQNINEHSDVEQMFTIALRGILYTKESAVVKHFRINFRKIFVLNCKVLPLKNIANRLFLHKTHFSPSHVQKRLVQMENPNKKTSREIFGTLNNKLFIALFNI